MKKISPEIRERLPQQCQQCPVVRRFDFILQLSEDLGDKFIKKAQEHLDLADKHDSLGDQIMSDTFRSFGQSEGRLAMTDAELQMLYEKKLDEVIAKADNQCPGSMRGTDGGGSRFYSVMAYLAGERTCLNPAFEQLVDDSVISVQLKMGNWHSEGVTDQ